MMRCFVVALVAVSMTACGDAAETGNEGSALTCTTSSDCSATTVCANNMCIAKCSPSNPCEVGYICNGSGECIPDGSSSATCTPTCEAELACGPDGCGGTCGACDTDTLCAKNTCVPAAECTMTCMSEGATCGEICGESCGTCAEGEVCSLEFACVAGEGSGTSACTDTCESTGATCGEICGESCGTCAEGETCTDGSCAAPPQADCNESGCPQAQVCNTETGACEEPAAEGSVCAPCADDADCAAGWSCAPLSSGKVCLEDCTSNNDCETGWSCVGTDGACTPDLSYSCAGCVAEGCPDGGTCDPASGQCATPKATCATCSENWECGPNAACAKQADGSQLCAPRCDPTGANACGAEATCAVDADSNIYVCSTCASALTCGGSKPIAHLGQCVECTEDSHCTGGGTCNMETMSCEGGACSGNTPFDLNGTCVQCLGDDDCPGDATCNQSNSCEGGSAECANDSQCSGGLSCNEEGVCAPCGECTEDYPVCLELQGESYCVQCTEDSHCAGGCTCDTSLYACTGNCVVSGAEECTPGDNSTCPDHPEYDLICHESGLCVADNGGCDGVTVNCPFGNPCVSLLDLLLGGGGGGLGGLPLPGGGGGTGIPGSCSCTPNGEQDPSSDDCPGDVQCAGVDLLGSGSETTVCSTLTCEDILGELVGELAAVICALL